MYSLFFQRKAKLIHFLALRNGYAIIKEKYAIKLSTPFLIWIQVESKMILN